MDSFFRRAGRRLLRMVAAVIGARIIDQRTGACLGRALFIPWRGRLHVIGLEEARVRAHFLPQERLTYWRQELAFSSHPEPDFPNEADAHGDPDPSAGD